ncbi:LptF/LptG family permease [Halodesulfovibrio marinisediminis]|uniref:Lipopolysaccharide export system permease protein n=1 Tax=Halodesulfovibrio marinisediminis DSM 17456 TaxID=1121457 RepID=A0A1N6DXY8_9BACT|nr:LptF/LptG family permease [Halodesulfovibrio marinisediminis]SIN75649.1 lipopolysaccharide export system permease protein [Halodesulfovibrio marinisediminis DSM 17456]
MSLLSRYMLKQNLFLMLLILGIGTAVYLMTDLFEKLDDFLEAGLGFSTIALYFICKLPLIISQILPAVFLLSCTVQLCVMSRSKELVALQAGGVSFMSLARFIVYMGLFWAVVQLGFSQYLGVMGDVESRRIWSEEVRGKTAANAIVHDIWFLEDEYIINLGVAHLNAETAENVTVMRILDDGDTIQEVIKAKRAVIQPDSWMLLSVVRTEPGSYVVSNLAQLTLPIQQKLGVFKTVSADANLNRLSLWELGGAIDRLEASGSNVEALRTTYHQKIAYAAAVLIMGLVALMLLTWKDSLYINISVGLILTFVFYALFTWFGALGERGLVNPVFGAWFPNVLFAVITLGRVLWYTRSRVKKTSAMTLSGSAQ